MKPGRKDFLAEASAGGYRLIDLYTLRKLHEKGPGAALLIDASEEEAFRKGHITGALPFKIRPTWWSRFRSRRKLARLLGPDLDRSIVFY